MTTPAATPTARDVVADYLAAKAETTKPNRQRDLVSEITRAIVDELPDGFTIKDVRVCVGVLADGDPMLTDFSGQKRARQVTSTLNAMVADELLALDGDEYRHTDTP